MYVCVRVCVRVCMRIYVRVWSDQVTMVTMTLTWSLTNNIKPCKKTYRHFFSENQNTARHLPKNKNKLSSLDKQ